MTLVQDSEEISNALNQVRAVSRQFRTNFFPVARRLQEWIKQGSFFMEKKEGAVFFFRKDREICHYYFAVSDLRALEKQMSDKERGQGGPTDVMDLVGKESDLAELLQVTLQREWKPYQTLMRLMRLNNETSLPQSGRDHRIALAESADQHAILRVLEERFDPLCDQLPTIEEVKEAIQSGGILIVRESDQIAGLLFFEATGLSSTLRYWVVRPEFARRGLGSCLLRAYLEMHRSVKRFVLWVNETNNNAIQKYQYFGYKPDGLKDKILIRENTFL